MGQYAQNTSVSVGRSKAEIEDLITRYGASGYMTGWQGDHAMVQFQINGKMVRFILEVPDRDSDEFRLTPSGKRERSEADQFKAWEQAQRQRWRALMLVIKAKLEATESGISTFESEFMAHIVMPDGRLVSEHVIPKIEEAYEKNSNVKLLPDLRG